MKSKKLFLLGSGKAFEVAAEEFVPAAGGNKASIILLLFSKNEKTPKYVSEYAEPWLKRGIADYDAVMPDTAGMLDIGAAKCKIAAASGIFIGGGTTERYRELFATEPIVSVIREKYEQGIPVAGCSAGAIVSMDRCPHYNAKDEVIGFKPGLSLVEDILIMPHYSEHNELEHLLDAMKQGCVRQGLGIDEPACAVFVNGKLDHTLGKTVHRIVVNDLNTMSYEETLL
jgi:cyanophycinase